MALHVTPALLDKHARELAATFGLRLITSDQLRPEEALAIAPLRAVLCGLITEETTYAVALHELGHLASPTGTLVRGVRPVAEGDTVNLVLLEERSAWEWAQHYALVWTPAMESVKAYALGTYERLRSAPPPASVAPTPPAPPSIDWNRWK